MAAETTEAVVVCAEGKTHSIRGLLKQGFDHALKTVQDPVERQKLLDETKKLVDQAKVTLSDAEKRTLLLEQTKKGVADAATHVTDPEKRAALLETSKKAATDAVDVGKKLASDPAARQQLHDDVASNLAKVVPPKADAPAAAAPPAAAP